MWRGVVVFAITYLLVASRRVASRSLLRLDRPAGALVGALLAVVLGALTPREAAGAIDLGTVALLFAVMGMGAFLSVDGFFERAGDFLLARARTPARLVGVIVWASGALSAVVTNDAVCLLAAPIVVGWIARHRLPRRPLLLALATGANTGSVATLVGNPQNMLCGSLGALRFASFLGHMFPVALVGLALNHAVVHLVFRRELEEARLPAEVRAPPAVFTRRSAITMAVVLGTVVVYSAGGSLPITALGGFVVLLLVHREEPAHLWAKIDWSILLFFAGLFVAVEAFVKSGAPAWAFARAPLVAGATGLTAALRASMLFLVGSNVVTNVPFILVVRTEMARFADPVLGWELLAMASTFAGNLTLLGSVANVIVAEKARDVGGLQFGEYLEVGVPVATLTTLTGTLILMLIHG